MHDAMGGRMLLPRIASQEMARALAPAQAAAEADALKSRLEMPAGAQNAAADEGRTAELISLFAPLPPRGQSLSSR